MHNPGFSPTVWNYWSFSFPIFEKPLLWTGSHMKLVGGKIGGASLVRGLYTGISVVGDICSGTMSTHVPRNVAFLWHWVPNSWLMSIFVPVPLNYCTLSHSSESNHHCLHFGGEFFPQRTWVAISHQSMKIQRNLILKKLLPFTIDGSSQRLVSIVFCGNHLAYNT